MNNDKINGQMKRLEEQNCRLAEENQKLQEENRLLKLQIQELRDKFFKKNTPKPKEPDEPPSPPKKRGAPVGHPGVTRKPPDHVDEHVDVHLEKCPECGGTHLRDCRRHEDHYQEDIILPKVKVTRFRHHVYYCPDCQEEVCGIGPDELPGSYIGPTTKSLAVFLHYQMKIPYRKIRLLFHEIFHLDFNPSSCPGFDQQIRNKGSPLYAALCQRLKTQPFVHIDETGWRKDGINHWLWCFIASGIAVYRLDRSRGGKVVTAMLGKRFAGVMISDFLAAYNQIPCRKQRCLIHLLRLIKKWQIYFVADRRKLKFFLNLKKLVKSILLLSSKMMNKRPGNFIVRKADLTARLRRALSTKLDYPRADKFLRKLSSKFQELVTCLDDDKVCAHNNIAERLLRDNVIMRKITFGNRSENGMRNHEVLTSLIQTARMHNLNPLLFLRLLITRPAAAPAALLPLLS